MLISACSSYTRFHLVYIMDKSVILLLVKMIHGTEQLKSVLRLPVMQYAMHWVMVQLCVGHWEVHRLAVSLYSVDCDVQRCQSCVTLVCVVWVWFVASVSLPWVVKSLGKFLVPLLLSSGMIWYQEKVGDKSAVWTALTCSASCCVQHDVHWLIVFVRFT